MTKDEELVALRALIIEFIDVTGWMDHRSGELRDIRHRAAELVPEIVGNHPDDWSKIVEKAKELRQ